MNPQGNNVVHQNQSVQKENTTSTNSKDVVDMVTYKDKIKITGQLEKTNWLENPEQSVHSLINNIQQAEVSILTQTFHVLLKEENYLIQFGEGSLAKFYAHIMEQTGTKFESSFVKDQGLYITVFGNSETVTKAHKAIFEWCQEQDLTVIPIPKQEARFVIGRTGDKAQDLEQNTTVNTQIICPLNQSNSVTSANAKQVKEKFSERNLPKSVKNVKDAMQSLEMEKTINTLTTGSHNKENDNIFQETEEQILFPLSSATEIDLEFNSRKVQEDQADCCVNDITEKTEKKIAATDVVMNLQQNCNTGLKRNFLQEILETTRDSTDTSPSESMSDSVTQYSEPDSSGDVFIKEDCDAKDYIVCSISAPSWLHRYINDKKCQTIAEITDNVPKVHIHFTGEDKIILKGSREDVNYAQGKFEVIVNDLISRMDYTEINSNSKLRNYLTGNNGTVLNKIRKKYQVSISVFPDQKKNNHIRIEGESPNVQQAKRALLELANDLEEEHSHDIIIKHQLHHILIGQKGERVREICKKFPDVILNFPHPAEKSDIVQLIGPKYESEQCAEYLENMLTDIKENNYSVTIPILKRFHKKIIGKGGSNIKQISETTNTEITFPSESSNSEDFVITGYPENCEIARNWIHSIQQEIEDMTEEEISISSSLYKYLTDSKDYLIRSIIEECGNIHIHFPRNKSGLQKVIITGHVENVEKAKEKLLQLTEEEQTKNYSVTLRVKSQYHQFLMNKNGGNISKICEETGTCVLFPTLKNKDQECITITGREEAVKRVQKQLAVLIKELDNVVEDSILINRKFHHYFVMQKGQLLREMTEDYGGVIITFSYAGKHNTRVTLRGAKACVEAAKKHIQEIFEPLFSQVTTRYVIPQKFHPFIMGPINSRIQQIARDYKVQIKFPDIERPTKNINLATKEKGKEKGRKITKELSINSQRKSDIIFISGQVENCKAATQALESLIPATAEVHVPFHLHPYIIGHKGSGLRKLIKEFEVHIEASQLGKNSDIISIMGLAANVEQAKMKLQKRVKALQMEIEDRTLRNYKLTFTIDPKYRYKITGHKGLLIAQICTEHDVTIHFPKKGSHEIQDQITITGYRENTMAARDAIMKILHRIEKTISKEIPLNHQVRSNIIGFHGKSIQKIMDQFQVDIRLPPKGSYNPNITLTGLPENVQNAIHQILNLEKYYLSSTANLESQQEEHTKSVSLCNITTLPSKNFMKPSISCNARTTPKLPDLDNCEHFPRLKQQIPSRTHTSKL